MTVSINANSLVYYTVAANNVKLQSEPNINSKILAVLPINSTVISLNKNLVQDKLNNPEYGWIFVRSNTFRTKDGKSFITNEGWVVEYYLLKWGTSIGSKGFEKIKRIRLDKNMIELISYDDPAKYDITINENGIFDIIIDYKNLSKVKEKGQIYRYRDLYLCESKEFGFSFHISNHKYVIIKNIGFSIINPSKIKILEEPVGELIK